MASEILRGWRQEIWSGLTASEQQFMTTGNGLMLWQIYANLSALQFRPTLSYLAILLGLWFNMVNMLCARSVLTAAGLTYLAAAVTSVLQLLYYISLAERRS